MQQNAGRAITPLRALGVFAALASLVLVVSPTLVHDPGPAPDVFEATERHVRWGLGISLGALLFVNRWRRPWSVLFAWTVFCLSSGYLVARFIGMAIEGPTNQDQWVLVAVEVAVCAAAAFWIHRKRDAPDRP